jgi:iron complex outermembrane receptor protein
VTTLLPRPHLVFGVTYVNGTRAVTYGSETSVRWQARPWWRVDGSYSYIGSRFESAPGTNPVQLAAPNHQWNLGSRVTLTDTWEGDARLFSVGHVPTTPQTVADRQIGRGAVDGYRRLDVRVGRRVGDGLSVSVSGQNLLHSGHVEGTDALGTSAGLVPRSVGAQFDWEF